MPHESIQDIVVVHAEFAVVKPSLIVENVCDASTPEVNAKKIKEVFCGQPSSKIHFHSDSDERVPK